MILPFSQRFKNGEPTHFLEKIWLNHGLWTEEDAIRFSDNTTHQLDFDDWCLESCSPKIHTIREDKTRRWCVGKKIHAVFNNRTKDTYVQTNFRAPTFADPNGAPSEKKINMDGWFVATMPDYNQKNPHIATYLDQLYLWWIEFANLSGYRIDTYPYPDQDYMNHLMELLLKEYPQLTIYGETWVQHTTTQATFVRNNIKGFEKNRLPGVTDFSMCWAFQEACSKPFGWTEGLNRVYITQSEDFLYQDPYKNCTFLDNHDISRFYSIANEDIDAWKRGITLLLTTRGLPCIYYGTEILMTGKTEKSDAYVRFDFPGGWNGDPVNKFIAKGRTSKENDAWKWMQTLNKASTSIS